MREEYLENKIKHALDNRENDYICIVDFDYALDDDEQELMKDYVREGYAIDADLIEFKDKRMVIYLSKRNIMYYFKGYMTDMNRANSIAADEADNADDDENIDWTDTYDMLIDWFCQDYKISDEEKKELKDDNVFQESFSYEDFSTLMDDAFANNYKD